ncbi:hypothetical protein CANARDRAFT_70981 [[Candida] arabinofermentans NRRL YB-2248]|uniref:Uncharacterized protein n=1 Tax=[Candida] arabinofermentans NRRL YB-2248 TaxID=983967 RepID=A0A1E4SX61_9ASCO|nr:hypothetical protein CANARDRAFT_70981 [[Candida] arabinofermentans NRRL YB-2248]
MCVYVYVLCFMLMLMFVFYTTQLNDIGLRQIFSSLKSSLNPPRSERQGSTNCTISMI